MSKHSQYPSNFGSTLSLECHKTQPILSNTGSNKNLFYSRINFADLENSCSSTTWARVSNPEHASGCTFSTGSKINKFPNQITFPAVSLLLITAHRMTHSSAPGLEILLLPKKKKAKQHNARNNLSHPATGPKGVTKCKFPSAKQGHPQCVPSTRTLIYSKAFLSLVQEAFPVESAPGLSQHICSCRSGSLSFRELCRC